MLRRTVAALVLALALCAAPRDAAARTAPGPRPHRLYAESDLVCTGKVVSVGAEDMKVVVDEVLKGSLRPAATVTVFPIHQPACVVDDDPDPSYFIADDLVVVAAKADGRRWRLLDHTLFDVKAKDPAALRAQVALAREMLRIAALGAEHERRAAMVRHMASEDLDLADAAMWFQFEELDTPEKAAPHAAGLVAALAGVQPKGRKAALRALVGVTAPEALAPLIALLDDGDAEVVTSAAVVLARYDAPNAFGAVLALSRRPGFEDVVGQLGSSPRPEAHDALRAALFSGGGPRRTGAVQGLAVRFGRVGASEKDVDDLLAIYRAGFGPESSDAFRAAVIAARSPRLAAGVVDVLREPASADPQWRAGTYALWWLADREKLPEVLDLLRREEDVFIRRLDAGGAELHLFWILRVIGSKATRSALERAQDGHPDEHARHDARRALERN
jgi:hypothetical protein